MTHQPNVEHYLAWLQATRGLHFEARTPTGYDALWRWSVNDLDAFWGSLWDYFELESPTPHTAVLADARMPGAVWFPGASLNYVQQVFRHADAAEAAGQPAIVFQNEAMREGGEVGSLGWADLRQQVASLAAHLRAMGVEKGDRVCAFLPNVPETVVAFLAVASLGAVWSVCSPDMGPLAVLDRFAQIEPKVLIACETYRYGGVLHDRREVLREVVAKLPSLTDVVVWRQSGNESQGENKPTSVRAESVEAPRPRWHDFTALIADAHATLTPAPVPFAHPLWIVYSSGTTGLPKPIVHGHGGVVIEALKFTRFHLDLGSSADTGDRVHWYSATGWIMWNCQIGGLLNGTTICLYDGSPSGPAGQADWTVLWRFAEQAQATFFGAGSAFFASCLKAGAHPAQPLDLSRIRAIGATGSPLSVDAERWVAQQLPHAWLNVLSGGTDFAGAFIAGLPTLPVTEGEMQCRCLGAAVEAWSEQGQPLVDEVGELVCTKPLPSMPLYFWNDPEHARYRDSYFDMFEGVWRHGDWLRITPRGGAVIYGRSDATINRHGIRMGTAELYRAVEALPEVLDSLVVDLEYLGRESYMPLFVVLREGVTLDDALKRRLREAIKTALSSRHVPNELFQVSAIPRTLSGKKMELPVKKLLLGATPEQVFKLDAMANADAVPWFAAFAQSRA
jgi:acetoacetyl-CoA synthetase